MATLFDPLDEPQTLLLNLLNEQFVKEGAELPYFSYISRQMLKSGYDAAEVIGGLPTLNFPEIHNGRYSAVWTDTAGSVLQRTNRVGLTMAGLYHVGGDGAQTIIEGVLSITRAMSKAQDKYADNPFTVPAVDIDIKEALRENERRLLPWVAKVAEHEFVAMNVYNSGSPAEPKWRGELRLLTEAEFVTAEDYLTAITALATPQHESVFVYTDPLALPRAITSFERSCELALKTRLVVRPAVDRTVLFGADVASHSELQSGLSALGELLGDLDVPGKKPSHALGRLFGHLTNALPSIDQTAVKDAIDRMDAVREIRNTGQHDKTKIELIAAHDRLGLTFPIRDPAGAWDTIRAQMVFALHTLGDAIYAARI